MAGSGIGIVYVLASAAAQAPVQVPVAPPAPPAMTVPSPPPAPRIMMAPPAPPPPPLVIPVEIGPVPKEQALAANPDAKLAKKEAKQFRKDTFLSDATCLASGVLTQGLIKSRMEACDKSLARPAVEGSIANRRAQLLQRRAVLSVANGSNERAIEALEEVDSIGAGVNDPLWDLSLGIGNRLLRAWMLGKQGKKADALAMLAAIRAARPYSTSVLVAADRIEMAIDPSFETMKRTMEGRMRLDPEAILALAYLAMANGQADKAGALAEQVSKGEPSLRGGWTLKNQESYFAKLRSGTLLDAVKAYAAASKAGEGDTASHFAAAHAKVAEYIGQDPLLAPKGTKVKKSAFTEYELRKKIGQRLDNILDDYEDAAKLRRSFKTETFDTIMARANKWRDKSTLILALLDVIKAYTETKPFDVTAASAFHKSLVDMVLVAPMKIDPLKLVDILPRNEVLSQVTTFNSNSLDWLWGDGNGYTQTKELGYDGDVRTIRFENSVGTPAMTEELSMMAAVMFAEKDSKPAFIILSNRTIRRTITISYGWYGGGSPTDAGFEASSLVRMLDSAEPPKGMEGRVITVAEIKDKLWPRYQAYNARKVAEAAAKKAAAKRN